MKRVYIELQFENKDKKEDVTEADVYNYLHELLADNYLDYEVEEDDEEEEYSDPCPECGAKVVAQGAGGVKCSNSKCGYWFCF